MTATAKVITDACDSCGVSANVLTCLQKYGQPPKQLKFEYSTYHKGICDWCGEEKAVTDVMDYFNPTFDLLANGRVYIRKV